MHRMHAERASKWDSKAVNNGAVFSCLTASAELCSLWHELDVSSRAAIWLIAARVQIVQQEFRFTVGVLQIFCSPPSTPSENLEEVGGSRSSLRPYSRASYARAEMLPCLAVYMDGNSLCVDPGSSLPLPMIRPLCTPSKMKVAVRMLLFCVRIPSRVLVIAYSFKPK